MSHLGRPEGRVQPKFSLAPVATELSNLIGQPVTFIKDCASDEAVTATIQVRRDEEASRARIPDVKRALSQMRRPECVQVVREAVDIIKRSQNYILKDKFAYGSLAGERRRK